MIGSHDSFTYLNATSSLMNNFTRYWRCQNKTIMEQYKAGVRFFDVRVKREVNSKGEDTWRVCHGPAELTKVYPSLKSICIYFCNTLKGSSLRLWLEKGTDEDWEHFKSEVTPLITKYPKLYQVLRKSNYEVLVQKETYPKIEYLACKMEDKKNWFKGLFGYPVKEWAKEHNPVITKEMINDPNVLYLMDYVCGVE